MKKVVGIKEQHVVLVCSCCRLHARPFPFI